MVWGQQPFYDPATGHIEFVQNSGNISTQFENNSGLWCDTWERVTGYFPTVIEGVYPVVGSVEVVESDKNRAVTSAVIRAEILPPYLVPFFPGGSIYRIGHWAPLYDGGGGEIYYGEQRVLRNKFTFVRAPVGDNWIGVAVHFYNNISGVVLLRCKNTLDIYQYQTGIDIDPPLPVSPEIGYVVPDGAYG